MNSTSERPICLNCKKPMRLFATGRNCKTYFCMDCKEKEIIELGKTQELISAVTDDSRE